VSDEKDSVSIEADEFGMWDSEASTPAPRPWGLALLLLALAAVFAGMIAYGVARIVGQVNG
jgi:hypothetical protein